jgi:hypothetical protein
LGTETLQNSARDAWERAQADALIVSGFGTGLPPLASSVETVRQSCPKAPLLIGSGFTADNAPEYLPWIQGAIVGSSLKRGGRLNNPVDPVRVKALVRTMRNPLVMNS